MRTDGEPAIRVVRSAVAKELKEQHGIRVIQQGTPTASAGLVENAVKQVKDKVRVLVIGARELHGATIDLNHVTLPWCIKFAGHVLSRTVKGQDGLTAFQRAYQRKSHPRPLPAAWGEKVLYLEASKRKAQLSNKFEDGIFLGIKDGTEELIVGTSSGDREQTLQTRFSSTVFAARLGVLFLMTQCESPEYQCNLTFDRRAWSYRRGSLQQITPDRAGCTSVRQWNWQGSATPPTAQAARQLSWDSLDLRDLIQKSAAHVSHRPCPRTRA